MWALLMRLTAAIRGRHPNWRPDRSNSRIRRWNGNAWEYRDMTETQKEETSWWWAIR
jgi:hypothetical protein